MILYPHQQKLVDRNPHCHLLAFDRGTGKTITAIALGNKNCRKVLVVVPKINKEMWIRETKTYGGNNTVYTVITKEEFKRDFYILPRPDGVIIDEAHHFAGMKSAFSKMMYRFLKKHDVKYRWLCTATPYLSTPMNIYVLGRLLGHEWNYVEFQHKFFYMVRMGFKSIPKVKPGIEEELAKWVSMIGTTTDLEEAVEMAQANPVAGLPELGNIPTQSFETEYFELTKSQKDGIAKLDEPTFITRWTKTHCIENGLLYSDGYTETETFDCLKIARIIELAKENKKIAIFCRYNHQIQHIHDLLRKAGEKRFIYILNGDTKNRDAVLTDADNQEEAIILIQAQCSAGYELPSFPVIVFASLSFSYVDYIQAVGRFLRINKMKENRYIHLVTQGVDRDIYDCIMRKQDFSLAIYGNVVQ